MVIINSTKKNIKLILSNHDLFVAFKYYILNYKRKKIHGII